MRKWLLFFLFPFPALAQDSTYTLEGISVQGYLNRQTLLKTPASAAILDSTQLKYQPSWVPLLNTVPGIRMEERSPGSYRLSIRGSLLRSPYGVRNVKVYLDEYPLTDAGGNTYLNAISMRSVQRVELLKGPDGSLFGANSGGVMLIRPGDTSGAVQAGIGGGSYGLFQQHISASQPLGKHKLHLSQSFQRSDGYRQNTKTEHLYLHLADHWQYNQNNHLQALVFYSAPSYRTPGGLTLAQFEADPKQARANAISQKAGIYNKMLFGGITHQARIAGSLQHMISVYASTVDFRNPFLTNYEVRKENTYGMRTYFTLRDRSEHWEYNAGLEWQQTAANIHNYDNNAGERGNLQAYNDILSDQHFFFTRFRGELWKQLVIEGAVSLNYYSYHFRDTTQFKQRFDPQWMPRLALNYLVTPFLSVRASVSRGYSAPTTAEIRPADNRIYRDLQAENGWNYEAGIRLVMRDRRFQADASVFHYRLQDAIVRRLNDNGTEYFVNAGGTKQTGVESILSLRITGGLLVSNSFTLSLFRFEDHKEFNGNKLTGVPEHIVVTNVTCQMPLSFYLFAQHNYTGKLPLNDANTAYADAYHLVLAKAGWRMKWLEIYAGVDNLLNQRYSLGNDINAFGNRYYNPALARNYFAGILVTFRGSSQ